MKQKAQGSALHKPRAASAGRWQGALLSRRYHQQGLQQTFIRVKEFAPPFLAARTIAHDRPGSPVLLARSRSHIGLRAVVEVVETSVDKYLQVEMHSLHIKVKEP